MTAAATTRRIRDDVKAKFDEGYPSLGEAFAHVAIRVFFELDEDQALEACDIGGTGDRGIDAYVHDEDEQQVIVAQAKYASRAKRFGVDAASDLITVWTTLQQIGNQERPRAREQVIAAAKEIRELRAREPEYPVGLYCFAAGTFSEQAQQTVDAFNRQHADDHVAMHLIGMDELADAYEQNESRVREQPIGDVDLVLERSFRFRPYDDEPETLVGAINCLALAEVERRFRYRVFQRNVRFFLTARRRENQGIKRTLETPAGRSRFWFYNNGISIVCDSIRGPADDGQTFTVENLQIVNGCQTTTTLGENIARLRDPAEAAYVLVRIVAEPDETLQSQISLYNNRQNAVTDRDLQSNDPVQQNLQQEFDMLNPPWFYEKKRGEWDARIKNNEAARRRYGTRRLENAKVAQAAYAFHIDPAVARARKKFLFVKRIDDDKGMYEAIFNDRTTPEWLLLPSRLAEYVNGRRSAFMRQFKDAQAEADRAQREGRQVTQQVTETLDLEWIKFADQFLLGAMGHYIRRRVDLDHDRLATLLNDETLDRVAVLTYEQALADLTYFFLRKHGEAENRNETFVPSNYVKGNWAREVEPVLTAEENLRERTGRSVFAGLAALGG